MTEKRAYTTTHPWITFSVDMRSIDPKLWVLLGEATALIQQIAGSPLKPSVAQRMHLLFLAKGVVGTTAIEGNTLTEEEALALMEGKLKLPPSQRYLGQEIENILAACNSLIDRMLGGAGALLTPETICDYNRQVLDGLELDKNVVPGAIRSHSVTVGRYRGAPAADCGYLLQRLCDWLAEPGFVSRDPDWALPGALLRAIVAHLYLAWIHPFGDGNGRTARLVEYQILLEAGVPIPTGHLLSNHYNLTRADYYRHLDQSSRVEDGDPLPFIVYAIRGFVDGLQEQLKRIREQQSADRWEQFVYESFGGNRTTAAQRRLNLALELSKAGGPVSKVALRRLSPELAEAYAGTVRTLSRDVNALLRMELIERRPDGGYLPRRDRIRAFLPVRSGQP